MLKRVFGCNCILSIFLLSNCSNDLSLNNWKAQEEFEAKYGKPEFKYHEINKGILVPEINLGNVILEPIYNKNYSTTMTFEDLTIEHKNLYENIFANENVMKSYLRGNVTTKEIFLSNSIIMQNERWKNGDQFAGFTIKFKEKSFDAKMQILETKTIGYILCGHADEQGCSLIAYLIAHDYQSQNIGTRALGLLMYHLDKLYYNKALVNFNQKFIGLVADCRTDNERSIKLLTRLGFKIEHTKEKYGSQRHHFSYSYLDNN